MVIPLHLGKCIVSVCSLSSVAGPHITVNGTSCLNLGTFNFLGLLGNQTIKASSTPTDTTAALDNNCHLPLCLFRMQQLTAFGSMVWGRVGPEASTGL